MEHSRPLNEIDTSTAAAHFRTARPFPFVVLDDFLSADFAHRVAESFPEYSEAAATGKEYRRVNEHGKVQVTDKTRFSDPVQQLELILSSAEFLETIAEITGIRNLVADPDLVGGGIHIMRPGAVLDVHIDFNLLSSRNLYRRLNILLFLNIDWRTEWGGQLELWDRDVQVCEAVVEPLFNRCVIFETSDHSFHGVRKVTCPKGRTRKSYAGYYYTNEAPLGWDGSVHSTVFRARPNETVKAALLLPLERIFRYSHKQALRVMRGFTKHG